jgi:threonine synthase
VINLWTHANLFSDGDATKLPRELGLTLGEGGTPLESCPALAERCGVRELLLKREDFNPSGSHKDRGLLYQVARHAPEGGATFVLSSSGNAAVSAAAACGATGNHLVAFVSPDTATAKLDRLLASKASVLICPKPINFARYASRIFGLTDLRGTKDPTASIGYRSIAGELTAQAPNTCAVFTFSSSGISIDGIADGYDQLGQAPGLWSVQSGECLGIVRALRPETPKDPSSPAGRLGIRNPPGATALSVRLVASGGGACAVLGADVLAWQGHLEAAGVATSAEGAAVLAGVAATPGLEEQQIVAILTGRAHHSDGPGTGADASVADAARATPPQAPARPESYLEVRAILTERLGLEPLG